MLSPEMLRQELHEQLNKVPGGAERLLKAIDEKRLNGGHFLWTQEGIITGCAYGHIYGNGELARVAASRNRNRGLTVPITGFSPMEHASAYNIPLLRSEVVAWLAEHGTAVETEVGEKALVGG